MVHPQTRILYLHKSFNICIIYYYTLLSQADLDLKGEYRETTPNWPPKNHKPDHTLLSQADLDLVEYRETKPNWPPKSHKPDPKPCTASRINCSV